MRILPRLAVSAALLLASACGPPPAASPRTAGLEREVREIIRRHAGDTAEVEVAFRDLTTGDSLLVDAHRPLHAASTMKVPVMLELFRRADAGEISLADSVEVRTPSAASPTGARTRSIRATTATARSTAASGSACRSGS